MSAHSSFAAGARGGRRLVAVMDAAGTSRILTLVFTDLAGSTALRTEGGDRDAGELIARHRALVGGLAAESGGRVVDWAGDGCFLTFETPSAAVAFALRLQRAERGDRDLPAVRMGLHMGEVRERPGPDGDATHPRVEGLAVDLGARIAGLARPGQVLMSSAVADSARQNLQRGDFSEPVRWRSYGTYSLKGFDEALEVREAGLEGLAPFTAPGASDKATPVRRKRPRSAMAVAAAVALAAALTALVWSRLPRVSAKGDDESLTVPGFAGRPALAVLPFDNLSPDPDQAFFADGLAEDLIARLSMWRAFPVIARNSSFQYRGGNVDVKKVSRELGVRYVLEGSVRRSGDRIRVTGQLIDAPSGEHVWAETYDRNVADVFALQDEISATIAASLVDDLNRSEAERARQRGPDNLEAWSSYELGLEQVSAWTPEAMARAHQLFARSIALDPRFTPAVAYLSLTDSWSVVLGSADQPQATLAEAMQAARRAVELDERDPRAQAALAAAYLQSGDAKDGLDAARRAVQLNPSMPESWLWLSWAEFLSGDPAATIDADLRAMRLSPVGPLAPLANDNLAYAYWELGRYQESLEAARRLVAAKPEYFWGYLYVALSSVSLGRMADAQAAIADARRVRPNLSLELVQRAEGVSRPELDARRDAALRKAGLE